jgi:arabinofuranosyltransferase
MKKYFPARLNFRMVGAFSFVFVVLCALSSLYVIRNAFYSVDDSFITYRYALNVLQGSGLVFNVGESYYGTTAAGYAALLALLAKPLFSLFPQLTIQNVSVGVSALSLLAIGAFMWVMVPVARIRWFDALIVWLSVVIAAFVSVAFNEAAGHETYTFLALTFTATLLAARGNMVQAGVVLALAATFRPDAMLMGPIIVLVSILAWNIDWRRVAFDRRLLFFSGAFLAIFLPWLGFLQLHFGRAFPGTMDAKKAQVAMGYWPLYKPAAVVEYVTSALTHPVLIGVLLGSIALVFNLVVQRKNSTVRRELVVPLYVGVCWLLYLILSTAFYFSISVTFWRWYGIPVVFSLFVAGYAGILCWLASDLSRIPGGASARSLSVILLGAVAASMMAGHINYWARNPQVNQHIYAYHEVADKLKELEPEGTTIAMAEPGAFAVRLGPKFKVLDELGLISPGVAKAFLNGDGDYLYRENKPKYIVCSWKGKFSGCDKPEVIAEYTLIGEFDHAFWQPHLRRGAQLYRLRTSDERLVNQPVVGVLDMVSEVQLGDIWGKLIQGPQKDELFLHPGASTDTSFVISCESPCLAIKMEAVIASLPPEAPESSGSVRLSVSDSRGGKKINQVQVDRKAPAKFTLPRGEYRITVNNNGDPSYDWLVLRITKDSGRSR